ncbi:glycosyl hydrolase [Salmonella enterica subsp. enterica]|nr:glycosyl hydrolase [Salmonella enterica subsp. enterica] [Salmonella enterica subsp. enterica serovar Menston]
MNSLPQRSTDFELTTSQDGFALSWQQRLILRHSTENPCLWIGAGVADIDMFRGNFSIKDKLNEKIALTEATVSELPDGWLVQFSRGATISATLRISTDEAGRLQLDLQNDDLHHNRIWLRLAANPDDHIYGCGEQFTYFDLRASRSRCGPANRALAVIKPAMSPGRQTAKRTPAATITGPSSPSQPLSARRSITATSIIAAI